MMTAAAAAAANYAMTMAEGEREREIYSMTNDEGAPRQRAPPEEEE